MAKRKNPLKDLDAFLKQEATTFVKPQGETAAPVTEQALATAEDIIEAINKLAINSPVKFREELFEIIKSSIEQLDHTSAEDKMLINTVLYLKDKDNWKKNLQSYWEEHL